jgi:carotenoid cleavage dioxygenase
MDSTKPGTTRQPDVGRRSFFLTTGAAFSGAIAAATTTGAASLLADDTLTPQERIDQLSRQLGMLEDHEAIRSLHQAYGVALAQGDHELMVGLFAEDGDDGRRSAAASGTPAHGFLLDHAQREDAIQIAPDRLSAAATFHCVVQAEAAVDGDSTLIEMMRQQGQDVARWWEGGVYENQYVKDAGGVWRIKRLSYRTIWRSDHADGSPARPPEAAPFAATYPDDPGGTGRPAPQTGHEDVAERRGFHRLPPVTTDRWEAMRRQHTS